MHIWLVKAEPLIRSWLALRLYVQPIRILILILMNVMEVKYRITSCSQDSVLNVGKIISATYHLNNGGAKRELNVLVGD